MFAEFDRNRFPLVKVILNNTPESDEDFQSFLDQWNELYQNQRDFHFLFDTRNVGFPHIKYSIRMAQFIKELRNRPHQYLQQSIILINNNKIKWMLDFIFTLQPPVAPVYIYNIRHGLEDPIDLDKIKSHQETSYVEPGKPFLPIL
tara:strand:- start:287 stop:724 length:438 start_codon:yes stop_codon:yes gene_type:complete